MKTLSQEHQSAIIEQIGSTYRNVVLSLTKDGAGDPQKVRDYARNICKGLVTVLEDIYKDGKF